MTILKIYVFLKHAIIFYVFTAAMLRKTLLKIYVCLKHVTFYVFTAATLLPISKDRT